MLTFVFVWGGRREWVNPTSYSPILFPPNCNLLFPTFLVTHLIPLMNLWSIPLKTSSWSSDKRCGMELLLMTHSLGHTSDIAANLSDCHSRTIWMWGQDEQCESFKVRGLSSLIPDLSHRRAFVCWVRGGITKCFCTNGLVEIVNLTSDHVHCFQVTFESIRWWKKNNCVGLNMYNNMGSGKLGLSWLSSSSNCGKQY